MTESPILFTGEMVRAIQRDVDPKWQTRRLITRANSYRDGIPSNAERWSELNWTSPEIFVDGSTSPAGNPGQYLHVPDIDGDASHRIYPRRQPGDRLWVRENGWERPERTQKMMRDGADTWERYYYDADGITEQDAADFKKWGFKRRPSIHMPRWASRINLEVTGMRVQQIDDISADDVIAEGISTYLPDGDTQAHREFSATVERLEYVNLWETINGRDSWDDNPWVWITEFKRA